MPDNKRDQMKEARPVRKKRAGPAVGLLALGLAGLLCAGVIVVVGLSMMDSSEPGSLIEREERLPTQVDAGVDVPAQATDSPAQSPTPIPQPTSLLAPTPVPTFAVGSNAPLIIDITHDQQSSDNGSILFLQIHFQDAEGDAVLLDWELVASTLSGVDVDDDSINLPAAKQMAGATAIAVWECGNMSYTVVLSLSILDLAGNRSDAVEYSFKCN